MKEIEDQYFGDPSHAGVGLLPYQSAPPRGPAGPPAKTSRPRNNTIGRSSISSAPRRTPGSLRPNIWKRASPAAGEDDRELEKLIITILGD